VVLPLRLAAARLIFGFIAIYQRLGRGSSSVLICTVLLSLPSFLIGCSLPLFAGYLGQLKSGNVFAKAYTLYNFGAAITIIFIEFWCIRSIGLKNSLISLALVNIAVSLVLRFGFSWIRDSMPEVIETVRTERKDKFALAIVSVGSAVFQLMMIKIAECLLGPYHETFALVLAIILFGIALGSAITGTFRIGFKAILIANLLGLCWFLGSLWPVFYSYSVLYPLAVESYLLSVCLKLGALFLIMGVPAISFGATIPALLPTQKNVARESGELLFISSIANAFGFLLMVFVLHRFFDYGVIILIIGSLTAMGLFIVSGTGVRQVAILTGFVLLFAGAYGKFWDENLLYYGHTKFHSKKALKKAQKTTFFPEKFKGYQDVFAINWVNNKPYFFINGYVSIPLDSPAEKIVGAFSSIFVHNTDKALILGTGSGATAGTVSLIFDDIDTVEINPVVIDNLHRMAKFNFDIENNERVKIINDDAINYTKTCDKRYSLIINTVTSPLYFSSAKLYTIDFLKDVRKRLEPGGVYVTWFDGRIGDRGLDIILKTISESFDYCAIGSVRSAYFLLICSSEPIRPRHPMIIEKNRILKDYFEENSISPSLLAYGLLSDQAFSLIGDHTVSINTLDYTSLEFEMARLRKRGMQKFMVRLAKGMSVDNLQKAISPEVSWNPMHLLDHATRIAGDSMITFQWQRLLKNNIEYYQKALEIDPSNVVTRNNKKIAQAKQDRLVIIHNNMGIALTKHGRLDEALAQFNIALKINPAKSEPNYNKGYILKKQGKPDEAARYFSIALLINPDYPEAHYHLGLIMIEQNKLDLAIKHFNEVLRINPKSAKTHNHLGTALARKGRRQEAIIHFQEAVRIKPDWEQAKKNLILSLTPDHKLD
jgi:spermidine synthase